MGILILLSLRVGISKLNLMNVKMLKPSGYALPEFKNKWLEIKVIHNKW